MFVNDAYHDVLMGGYLFQEARLLRCKIFLLLQIGLFAAETLVEFTFDEFVMRGIFI